MPKLPDSRSAVRRNRIQVTGSYSGNCSGRLTQVSHAKIGQLLHRRAVIQREGSNTSALPLLGAGPITHCFSDILKHHLLCSQRRHMYSTKQSKLSAADTKWHVKLK